jgi:hypothetical protein
MRKITLNFLVVFMLISCFEIRSTVALRVVRLREEVDVRIPFSRLVLHGLAG